MSNKINDRHQYAGYTDSDLIHKYWYINNETFLKVHETFRKQLILFSIFVWNKNIFLICIHYRLIHRTLMMPYGVKQLANDGLINGTFPATMPGNYWPKGM